MDDSSAQSPKLRPHPLAKALAQRLPEGASVLELGTGRGRNTKALEGAGLRVRGVGDADLQHFESGPALYDAVFSTHGFLHGTPEQIADLLEKTAVTLKPHGLLVATFLSLRDERCGKGTKVAAQTFAPEAGDEAGVPHSYFGEAQLRGMLRSFDLEQIEETNVDSVVGRWAHAQPLSGSVHWLVRARKR